MKLLSSVLVLSLVLGTQPALAGKRLGGGGSVGKQSSNVSQHNTAPTQPTATPQPAVPAQASAVPAAASQAKAPAAVPAAPAPKKPWGAMLGGLAAGLGLAWLASSLGLGEAFGNILLFGLLVVAVMVVVGMVMRGRQGRGSAGGHGLAYQGATGGQGHLAKDYSPQNVGNDASARPWERNSMAFDVSRLPEESGSDGGMIGSALPGTPSWGVPVGFDVDGFIQASKTNFVNLQAAWDRADIPQLRSMMTDEMLAQIRVQLADRELQAPGAVNVTEVVMLEARLLGIEEAEREYMASIEFSGMVREDPSAGPNPFREVWNITRPKAGTEGWLVAGVQALQ